MIDTHTHIIPYVDDGSDSIEDSVELIKEEIEQGVNSVICTPHYLKGSFRAPFEMVEDNYNLLKRELEKRGIKIDLHLAREIHFDKDYVHIDKQHALDGGKYVLVEFSTNYTDVEEICYEAIKDGYVPIVAHVERYRYFRSLGKIAKLRKMGAIIQVNALSIVDFPLFKVSRFVSQMIKLKLIDIVGSDVHVGRKNYMKKAYDKVAKYDRSYAEKIFRENAEKILQN